MGRRVSVEYIKDVESFATLKGDGSSKIEKGTLRQVDAASAKSLCSPKREGGPVAKLVGSTEEKAEAREALKSVEPGGVA